MSQIPIQQGARDLPLKHHWTNNNRSVPPQLLCPMSKITSTVQKALVGEVLVLVSLSAKSQVWAVWHPDVAFKRAVRVLPFGAFVSNWGAVFWILQGQKTFWPGITPVLRTRQGHRLMPKVFPSSPRPVASLLSLSLSLFLLARAISGLGRGSGSAGFRPGRDRKAKAKTRRDLNIGLAKQPKLVVYHENGRVIFAGISSLDGIKREPKGNPPFRGFRFL